jgi:hypothetical protein
VAELLNPSGGYKVEGEDDPPVYLEIRFID